MASKHILVCDKCGDEAPDLTGGSGVPMPVTPFMSPMDRSFPTLETSWWTFMTKIYGVAFPIDLCPTCTKKVLDFLRLVPRQLGDALAEPPSGSLTIEDLRKMGLVESEDTPP